MIYLVNQEWTNTSKNHAGMKYLCSKLQEKFPEHFKSICIKDYYVEIKKGWLARKVQHYLVTWQYKKRLNTIFQYLKANLKDGDMVVLMEYYERLYPQVSLAQRLKTLNTNFSVYSMVHLVPRGLDAAFQDTEFEEWAKPIDKFITLGSSLSAYLTKRGIPQTHVITLFHYVDGEYYHPIEKMANEKMKVIAMGNQMRNTELLRQIVLQNKDVDFIVCQGVSDMSPYFDDCKNVKLIPFVPEDELRGYMNEADVSLNVMVDTVGSNVITTSLAMGLAMICSDVGSIRDYCDETNTIFCNNEQDWVKAIHLLVSDRQRLERMQAASLLKSKELSIEKLGESLMSNGYDR